MHAVQNDTPIEAWSATSYENVFRDAAKPERADGVIVWDAARNEYESAQLVLRCAEAFSVRSVEFAGLTDAGGELAIPAERLEYRFVGYRYLPVNSERIGNAVRHGAAEYPEALANGDGIEVHAHAAQPIWITVHVPASARAGEYRGVAKVNTSLGALEAELRLKVYDVTLPEPRDSALSVFFWQWTAGWYCLPDSDDQIRRQYGYERYSPAWWSLMDKFAESGKAHRINHLLVPTVSLLADGGTAVDESGAVVFDWSRFDEFVQFFLERGGLKRLVGQHLAFRRDGWEGAYGVHLILPATGRPVRSTVAVDSPAARGWLAQYLPALQAHLADRGWDTLWLQHVADEPINRLQADEWITLRRAVAVHAPRLRACEALQAQDSAERFVGKLEVWVPLLSLFDEHPAFYEARRRAGDEVWFYVCNETRGTSLSRYVDQPVWMGRSLFWLAYARGATGFLHWGWNAWHYDWGDPWGDAATVYPDPPRGDIAGSIRHAAIRDGAEEYELLAMLGAAKPDAAATLARRIARSASSYETDVREMAAVRRELLREAEACPGTLRE